MKGVILAGGKATRLRPLTFVTNKHLLPVYNKPMIFYPLEAMAKAGIKDVLMITGPDHAGHFLNLLRSGGEFGLNLTYEIQDEAGGLSHAVRLAESFADNQKLLVILGDNIFEHDLSDAVKDFESQDRGARIFAKEMDEAGQYGVVEIDSEGTVLSIEEKPKKPKSKLAQTGIYMYDNQVFDLIKELKPSTRGELEITDLNNLYLKQGILSCEVMKGWWVDAGTSFDELLRASNQVAKLTKQKDK
ncbi:MAG: NTP transferase domain-containing protein [Candidatus Doudnabacteria bacterium]|nr:NTP transferase domain-containing protein [Candidatus Doudnabacteria bacterium]